MSSKPIMLVVALPPEAKPVNRRYGMLRDTRHDRFPLYLGEELALVVSGPGKEAAGQASVWLDSVLKPAHDAVWINLGIAGHATRPLGQAVYANTVEDEESGERWSVAPLPGPEWENDRLVTLNAPDTEYARTGLVDMEGAGFFQAVSGFTAPERIHCLKIVSDNRANPAPMITGKMVSRLIEEQLDILDRLFEYVREAL